MPSTSASNNVPQPIPVTMISGFRGAGKTTLLKYILENSTIKIACVVNDLSDFNVEPKHFRNSDEDDDEVATRAAMPDMAEMQEGCACCYDRKMFRAFEALLELGDNKGIQYDHLILENSGVAEPQSIRNYFNESVASGDPLASRIQLDTLVTVVDASTFSDDYASEVPMDERPDVMEEVPPPQPAVNLLVEQVECSDIVILNQADTVEREELEKIKEVITSLNPQTQIVTAICSQIPLELLNRSRAMAAMDIEAQHRTAIEAAKDQEHDHLHPPTQAINSGITSFIYSRRKAFHLVRLHQLICRWFPSRRHLLLEDEDPGVGESPIEGVLRSKGYVWVGDSHLTAKYWFHAGYHYELRPEGDWWATIPPDQFPQDPERRRTIYENFDPAGRYGDRRQEIVFIGTGMDEEEITKQLDAALFNDQEMEGYDRSWSQDQDPHHPDVAYFQELPKP